MIFNTGEQQDLSTNLTYLRARYYDPKLGRFLTPDSLIPDVTNGQALNGYAYVYNDPVNFTDPSGHIPNLWINTFAAAVPQKYKTTVADFFQGGNNLLNSWYQEPDDCSCQGQQGLFGLSPSDAAPYLGLTTQGVWAVASEPAQKIGNVFTTSARPTEFARHFHDRSFYQFPRAGTQVSRGVPINQSLRGWQGSRSVTVISRSSPRTWRVVRPTGERWVVGGMRGLVSTVVIAGLIDGVFQLFSDLDLCLSPAQRFNRAALATWFGMMAGLGGAIAFGLATMAGLSVLATIGISFAVGTAIGLRLNEFKGQFFEGSPEIFGA